MLTVSQLGFERYFRPVFLPLDFQLNSGSVLLITGANGSGKTTLIRLLAGVLTATQGSIRSTARGVVYVGHMLAIKDDLSVTENVRFMRDFLGRGAGSVNDAVTAMGLRRVADQLTRNLSAGQRKRCALARLLLARADLWLLDEPYSNLDEEGVELVDTLLQQHATSGGCSVMATHGAHRPGIANQFEIRLQPGLASA